LKKKCLNGFATICHCHHVLAVVDVTKFYVVAALLAVQPLAIQLPVVRLNHPLKTLVGVNRPVIVAIWWCAAVVRVVEVAVRTAVEMTL
jgi:hypothetical protein